MKRNLIIKSWSLFCLLVFFALAANAQTYKIVDTGHTAFYSNNGVISAPAPGDAFYGQDAQYSGNQPSYTDNSDGTITDNVTGLMWQQFMGSKISFADAIVKADTLGLAGYSDWRIPNIKELYSLILFTGQVSGQHAVSFFIDTVYFNQPLGDVSIGEREIDAQTWSSTEYVGLTMNGDSTVFGVNFVDGRIKGYPKYHPATGDPNKMYFRMVRGNMAYGINQFVDNGDSTVSDPATGLMWQKKDDGIARDWQEALAYAENSAFAGYNNWRLPNAKELQSIVDYSRSPQTTGSPAISPLFETTEINDPNGNPGHYPFFWSGTTHLDGPNPYSGAAYIAFGEGLGKMNGNLMDVHGAGCQRSDPKSGDPNNYPQYHGPQGDVQYVYNYVRLVREISTVGLREAGEQNLPSRFTLLQNYPNPFNPTTNINFTIESAGEVQVTIYDLAGQIVNKLVNERKPAGNYQVQWNSTNAAGEKVSSGVYLYCLESGNMIQTKKMVLMK